MEFERKNESGNTHHFEVLNYEMELFNDPLKINTASITIPWSTPMNMFDIVTISDSGYIPFRGYVSGVSRSRHETQKVELLSLEGWLNHRYLPRWCWMMDNGLDTGTNGDWLDYILTHETPPQSDPGNGISAYCPGLLWLAQSNVPERPSEFINTGIPHNVYLGYGTNSRIGTHDIYLECIKYTEVANEDACTAWEQFWRDTDNLYAASGYYGGSSHMCQFCADMAFDVGIRLRDLDNGSSKLSVPLKTNYNPTWDVFVKLVETFNLNVFIWYDQDGYTYIDVLESEGAGSSTGLYTIYENSITCSTLPPANRRCSALIGLGIGDDAFQQRYTAMDLSYKGLWVEDIENIPGGFADTDGDMPTTIEDRFVARNNDTGYKVEWLDQMPFPKPTDHVKFLSDDRPPSIFQIKTAKLSSSSPTIVEIGSSEDDLIDAFHPISEITDIYSLESPFNATSPGSLSGNITIGDNDTGCIPRTITGTIDPRVKNRNYRVLLSYSYDSGYEPMLAETYVSVNGSRVFPFSQISRGYMLNDSVTDMDITDHCKCDGTTETIVIYIRIFGLWSGSGPTVSLSTTVQPVWRRELPS